MKPDMREFNNYIEAAKKENVEMSTRLDAERSKNQVVLANVYAKLNPQISDKAREYFK